MEALHSQLQEEYMLVSKNCMATSIHRKQKNTCQAKETISPVLFTAGLEVFKLLEWEGLGVRVNNEYLGNLQFTRWHCRICHLVSFDWP